MGGPEGQKKLRDLRVGVAGLGGIGGNLAEIMVRLGVGHIKICDPDTLENSNLNRQVIANRQTIGMKKAHASAMELRNIAEDFELVVYDNGLTPDNAEEFVSDLDMVIDEIDIFPLRPRVWLHQAARKLNLPLYSGLVVGLGTHIFKFHGDQYTFEDFMMNNEAEIDNPSANFIMDRICNPAPSYLEDPTARQSYQRTIEDRAVPIFGASTYMAHSVIAIRMIADYMGWSEKFGVPQTPVMPSFLKIDPLDLSFQVCNIQSLTAVGDISRRKKKVG